MSAVTFITAGQSKKPEMVYWFTPFKPTVITRYAISRTLPLVWQ